VREKLVFTQTQSTQNSTLCACQLETIFIKVFMPGDKTAVLIGNMNPRQRENFCQPQCSLAIGLLSNGRVQPPNFPVLVALGGSTAGNHMILTRHMKRNLL
jgi:hypothetical protein